MSDILRVLLADDHPQFRAGLRALLLTEAGLKVVGEAGTGEQAVAHAVALQPDVILMDLNMPGLNGIQATRQIVHSSPHIAVLVVTMFEDDDSVFAALRAGARGYLLKGAPKAEVLRSVRAVANGGAIFGAGIARRMMAYFSAQHAAAPANAFPGLTGREHEILELLALHRTNPEIARTLVLSEKTVRNYVSNICSKLQVVDRAEAILRARDAGLGTRRDPA